MWPYIVGYTVRNFVFRRCVSDKPLCDAVHQAESGKVSSLKSEISSSEIFHNSLGYNIIRDDRLSGKGGGVLLVISKRLTCEEQPELKSDCNATWAKITIKGVSPPSINPMKIMKKSISELWKPIKKIPTNSITWILGDFNMPDIDWSNENIKNSYKFKTFYDDFMDNLTNFNSEQMVKEPTREENTLDLFLTN